MYLPISIWICGRYSGIFFVLDLKWPKTKGFFFFWKIMVRGVWVLTECRVMKVVHFGLVPYLHYSLTLHHYFCNLSLSLFPLVLTFECPFVLLVNMPGVHAYSLFDKSPKLCPFFIYLFHLVLFILFYFNPRAISIFHKTALVKLTPSSLI